MAEQSIAASTVKPPTPKSLITENGDNILPTLDKMKANGEYKARGLEMMDNLMQNVRGNLSRNTLHHTAWEHLFLMVGIVAQDLHPNFDATKFRELLITKHRLYGAEPLMEWGPLGIVIRISSKWRRYKNLKQSPTMDDQNESVVDTLTDIIGYAVLGCLLMTQGQ